jgi:hypothetical protein
MFVVIFRATVREMDDDYVQTAAALREMALRDFGCLEFCAVSEGGQEIALSILAGPRFDYRMEGAS